MIYQFGVFTLDTEQLELRRGNGLVAVEPQVFRLLAYLIENRHRVVSKQEVIDAVWDGRIISDATLNSRINAARRSVGDTGTAQSIIRTLPKRGFRFVTDITVDSNVGREPIPQNEQTVPDATQQRPSIVILPFKNVSGDPGQDYFAAGITEDVITALSRVRWLFVISRNSAFTYSSESVDLAQIKRELSVRYVLQGSVRVGDSRVRITGHLIDGDKGNTVWAERFDQELSTIFDLQDEMTSSIVSSLIPELSLAEIKRARQKRAGNLDAWDHYLHALSSMHQLNRTANDHAKTKFKRSVDIDPNFAAAHAGLAWCFVLEAILGWSESGKQAIERALRSAKSAVALDENDPLACCALAAVYSWTSCQDEAERAARRAIELDPNMAEAHGLLGYALGFQGRADEAISVLDRALRGSPRDHLRWLWYQGIANAHFAAERYADAIVWARQATELRSNWIFGYAVAAASAGLLGEYEQASSAVKKILELNPRYSRERARRNPMWDQNLIADRFFEGLRRANAPV